MQVLRPTIVGRKSETMSKRNVKGKKMSIKSFFFPRWKVVKTAIIEVEMESMIFKHSWTEDRILEEQENRDGDKRHFWVYENRRERVDSSFVAGHLNAKT